MNSIHRLIAGAALACAPLMLHANDGPVATASLMDGAGESVGEARIQQGPAGIAIRLEIDGLPAGWKAIHLHGAGTCDDPEAGFQASGGHVNPTGAMHGFLNPEGPDAGDLPNFHVAADGTAMVEMFNERASLDGSVGARLLDTDGSALVIHENPDDHMTQPIGGAGARLACGVLEQG